MAFTQRRLETAALIVLMSSQATHADIIASTFESAAKYNYEVIHMPDLDQRRGPGPGVVSLPSNGNMYCVPAAMMNMFAYIANHGYPEVNPGSGNWQNQNQYNAAGNALFQLGQAMNTDPVSGTNNAGWVDGTGFWIGGHSNFTRQVWFASGTFAPSMELIAQTAISGSLVTFVYGRFSFNLSPQGVVTLLNRNSGHSVTLVKAQRDGTFRTMRSRDPAQEPAFNLTQQSAFNSVVYTVQDHTVTNPQRTMTSINFPPNDGQIRLIDGVMAITPKKALTNSGGVKFMGPGNLTGGAQPTHGVFTPQGVEVIADLVPGPDPFSAFYIAANPRATPELRRINLLTGESTVLAPLADLSRLAVGRRRELYAAAPGEVHVFDTDAPKPAFTTVAMPHPVDAIEYNDPTDEVILLSIGANSLLKYPAGLDGEPTVVTLPSTLGLGGAATIAVNPANGHLWVMSEETEDLLELNLTDGTLVQAVLLPAIQHPRLGFCFDDGGHLFLATDGGLLELALDRSGAWQIVPNSPYADPEVGPVIRMTRSRTNYDPNLHDGPGFVNTHPDDLVEDHRHVLPDCDGDLNGDRIVDLLDLLTLLGAWGACPVNGPCAADIDQNGLVDAADLLEMLIGWGQCP